MLSFAIQPAEPVMFVDAVAGAVESIAVFAKQKISFVVSELTSNLLHLKNLQFLECSRHTC